MHAISETAAAQLKSHRITDEIITSRAEGIIEPQIAQMWS
jgi:hypothetical protein